MIDLTTNGFYASDDAKLTYYETPCPAEPKGIVLIVHGMAEHACRYHEFMDFLYQHHYLAVIHDQRGHGQTGRDSGNLGFFASGNGWERVVFDVKEISGMLKESYSQLPLFIIGHSMGSVVTRTAVIDYSELYQGAIIIGTTVGISNFMRKAGSLIARREIRKNGEKAPSKLLSNLSFGSYNRKFKPNRTECDWISMSKSNVDAYLQDFRCGFTCSAGFYRDLFYGLDYTTKAANLKKIPVDFPLLFLAGRDDPVGGMGREVTQLTRQLKKAGVLDVDLILYPLMRHEILNEDKRDLVYGDVLRFLNTHTLSE